MTLPFRYQIKQLGKHSPFSNDTFMRSYLDIYRQRYIHALLLGHLSTTIHSCALTWTSIDNDTFMRSYLDIYRQRYIHALLLGHLSTSSYNCTPEDASVSVRSLELVCFPAQCLCIWVTVDVDSDTGIVLHTGINALITCSRRGVGNTIEGM